MPQHWRCSRSGLDLLYARMPAPKRLNLTAHPRRDTTTHHRRRRSTTLHQFASASSSGRAGDGTDRGSGFTVAADFSATPLIGTVILITGISHNSDSGALRPAIFRFGDGCVSCHAAANGPRRPQGFNCSASVLMAGNLACSSC